MLVNGVERMIFVEALFVFVIIALAWLLLTLFMFKKLNKTRITGVLLIFLAFVGVAAVIFTVGHFLEWHETNEFCRELGCHAMDGPYESYTTPKNNTMMERHLEEDVPCAQCHSGPGFVGLGTSFLPVPSEMLHQYLLGYDENDLGGHVPAENCIKGCHEEAGVDWKFEAPMPMGEGYNVSLDGELDWETRYIFHPLTENGTDLHKLEKLETCLECHDARDNSFGLAAEACQICHDIEEEEMEAHGESTCAMASCHRDKDGNPVQPKLTGHNTVIDHCMECHSRDHPDDAFVPYTVTNSEGNSLIVNSSFCDDCHHETYEEFRAIGSIHYEENDCTQCHERHKTRPDCLKCHDTDEDYPVDHSVAPPFDDCSSCHVEGGHNPEEVTFQAQDSGSVSRDFCNGCHQTDIYDKIEDDKLHTQEDFTEDCLACHEVHEAEVDCSECHIDGGLAVEPEHATSQPFDDCISCHTEGHIPSSLNFSFFENTYQVTISEDFCVECHQDEKTELTNEGLGHATRVCAECHESHEKEDVDCFSCHSVDGPGNSPTHDVTNPYDDCTKCHENGHSPKTITFGVSIQTAFCADVSCHGGPGEPADIFENGEHANLPGDCKWCHDSHEVGDKCSETAGCHAGTQPGHDPSFAYDDCINCHKSAHDPSSQAPRPGAGLSQRDYMTDYWQTDPLSTVKIFEWIERGNHFQTEDCAQCHPDAQSVLYPAAAQGIMNVSGADCGSGCHDWIDPVTTGNPFTRLTDNSTEFSKHIDLFFNTTRGGCAGTCHQVDPTAPVYDGSDHGTITSCLDQACHDDSDFNPSGGYLHTEHGGMLNMGSLDFQCGDLCHRGSGVNKELIDGGCYDCHRSGHDPRILSTSPCYQCHATNQGE